MLVGRVSVGVSVLALRSRGGGIGLILLTERPVSTLFCDSGDELARAGLVEVGLGDMLDTESPSFFSFLTDKSSGCS